MSLQKADRIAKALSTPLPVRDLEALIAEVGDEQRSLQSDFALAQKRSLDPSLDRKAALAERERAENVRFELSRLEVARQQLGEATAAATKREANEGRRAAYDKVRTERDQLVKDLDQYTVLARQIVVLLTRIEENDKAIKVVNDRLPAGEQPMQSAEVVARDIPAHFRDAGGPIARLGELSLPAFRRDDIMRPLMWHRGLDPNRRNPG